MVPEHGTEPRKTAKPEAEGPGGIEQQEDPIDCVFLTNSARNYGIVSRLLAKSRIRLSHATTIEQADFLLTATGSRVILTESSEEWAKTFDMLNVLHPGASFVIAVEEVEREAWIEIAWQGICDVVMRPFSAVELRKVLESAHRLSMMKRRRRGPPAQPAGQFRKEG